MSFSNQGAKRHLAMRHIFRHPARTVQRRTAPKKTSVEVDLRTERRWWQEDKRCECECVVGRNLLVTQALSSQLHRPIFAYAARTFDSSMQYANGRTFTGSPSRPFTTRPKSSALNFTIAVGAGPPKLNQKSVEKHLHIPKPHRFVCSQWGVQLSVVSSP